MNQNRPDDERTTRIVTLDFNGGSHIYRNLELGMNIPVRIAPSGISADRARMLAETLNRNCADSHVRFEVGATSSENASAVHIGRTDAFDAFGRFLGLAEGIGSGDAFVLLDDSADDAELVDVIRHEAGHILGTLDHGGAGLARYAWERKNYDYRSAYLADKYPDQYKRYLSTITTTEIKYIPVAAPSGLDTLTVSYSENGTTIEYVYDSARINRDVSTERVFRTDSTERYQTASGIWAKIIYIGGGSVKNCTSGTMTVSGSRDYDSFSGYEGGEYASERFNYKYYQGVAIGCTIKEGLLDPTTGLSGMLIVEGNGVAKQCTAESITVKGALESSHYYEDYSSTETEKYQLFNGLAENCTVNGGWLRVEFGGIANDIIVRSEYASLYDTRGDAIIGCDGDIAAWREEVARAEEEGEYSYSEQNIAIAEEGFARYGSARANNLIVEKGNVRVNYGGELHNAKIDGRLYASEGASLSGVITCKSVGLSNVVPRTNITIRLDLNDYKVANATEYLHNEDGSLAATIEYFANYTTRTRHFRDGKVVSVTDGTFDNKDGHFDMTGWKYTFAATIGEVDEKALPYIVVDFGGTEKDFDRGEIYFNYPSTTHDIQFQLKSNLNKWKEYWDTVSYYDENGEYQEIEDYFFGEIDYNSMLFGEAADVLWLENGWDEETEYTVVLPDDVMKGATEELTVTDKGPGNNVLTDAELKGNKLVFKGGAESGNYSVKAEEKDGRDHECDLDLWVIPEEIPVLGKAGTKKLAEILKKMQTTRVFEFNAGLPHNIHTELCGMPFDLSDTGITITADFPQKSFSAKVQGKIEWKLNKDTAGTGKQLKLVIDLSGDNYLSITNTKGRYDWDLVGELKIPDFKLGKFEFSNMAMKVDVGKSSYSASAYVKLPWIKYAFGGSIGFVDGYWDSMSIGVDSLNVPLGTSGLFLQKIEGGISGIATELNLTFQGTLGLTAGPTFKVEYVDWLGIDSGEYSLCEITVLGTLTTNGNLSGEAEASILGGFITGGGGAGIKDGEFYSKGKYTLLNGCITVDGELRAGLSTGIKITGKGKMTVPAEKIFGPLAGMTLTVNAEASINVQNPDASYVKAWSDFAVMGYQVAVGFEYSFNKGLKLLGCDDEKKDGGGSPKRSLYALNPVLFDLSPEYSLRGAAEPSASKTFTVTGSGLTLFQVNLSVSDATMSLAFGGVEYTQADIAAGLYENMRIVAELSGLASELSGANCITVAVNDAAPGEWTIKAYGDTDATFNAYSLLSTTPAPVLIAVEVGEGARSATLRYTADFSDLTDATISIFRADAGTTDFTSGSKIAEIAAAAATGVYEYVMPDEVEGGDYSFYLAVNSDGRAPVYSAVSDAYSFRILDTEAPDQIQAVNSEWKSSGTVLTWEAPWDDKGVAGYKVSYRMLMEKSEDEETDSEELDGEGLDGEGGETGEDIEEEIVWTETDVKTNTFTFNSVPSGTYIFRVAAYDAANNLGAWSEEQSSLVLTAANAQYKDIALTEDLELAKYESAVGITAGDFVIKAEADTLISGSALGDAETGGIVENSTVNGIVTMLTGSRGYNLTVNGTLNAGGSVDGATVNDGGTLIMGAQGTATDITVNAGGSLALRIGSEYSGLTLAYGSSLAFINSGTGTSSGKYQLTDDIRTAGTLRSTLYLDTQGHKIRFEQYAQSAEYEESDSYGILDRISLISDLDKLIGDALEIEIDSTAYGLFKIADKAQYFSGAITVVDHADQSFAEIGFDRYTIVGHAVCTLVKLDDGLFLKTARAEIDAPSITVEYADSNAHNYIDLTAKPAENTGDEDHYTFRYSLNADMSDAVTVETSDWYGYARISKYDLVDNATYYVQVSVENTFGVTSAWSDAVSFTVTPKLLHEAPPPVIVTDATNSRATKIYLRVNVKTNDYHIGGFRFRYADNPEMENAVPITTEANYQNYLYLEKSKITDGVDYYVQAGMMYDGEWSYWSEPVVFNTAAWDYDGITISPESEYNRLELNGKRARNVTVVDGGYFLGGGQVDNLTVEAGGFFRNDIGDVTNVVVNGGTYYLDEGTASGITLNSGELRLMNGALNGATIGVNGLMYLDRTDYIPTISGTILIQGQFSIYSMHPEFSTDADFIFDIGAHEATKDKSFVDYISALGGTRTLTAQLDATPEIGDYMICNLSEVPENGLPISLVANDGTKIDDLTVGGDAILHNGLYYSLIGQIGNVYLHISDNQNPVFLGKFKFYKDGTMYDSGNSCNDLTVSANSACDYLLAENGAFLQRVNIGKGGSVDLSGDLNGATIWNGGLLTMKEGSTALMHDVCIQKGGTVIIEGGSVATDAVFQIAGTLTVDGILHSYEQDDQWGSSSHWFELRLDQLDAPAENVMISNYANLQCNPVIRVVISTRQAKGEYKLVGNASNFTGSISIRFDDVSNWSEYMYVGGESTFNGTKYALALKNDVLTLTVGSGTGPGPGPDDPVVPDGENDNLFDETGKLNGNVEDNPLKSTDDTTIVMDPVGSVSEGDYSNYVGGEKDKVDYAKITVTKAAKLSFTVNSDGKVKLTFYQLVEKKNKPGVYTKKALKSVTVSSADGGEKMTASVLVEGGDDKLYYVAVENKNKKNAGAYYNVSLNTEEGKNQSYIFADGDEGENDGPLLIKVGKDKVANTAQIKNFQPVNIIESGTQSVQFDTNEIEAVGAPDVDGGWNNFVGFGDTDDYVKLAVTQPLKLNFTVTSTDNVKLTVYKLTLNKGKWSSSAVKTLTVSLKSAEKNNPGYATRPVNGILLDRIADGLDDGAGYYVSVESTNAKKGGKAWYNVSVDSVVYKDADEGVVNKTGNGWLLHSKTKQLNTNLGEGTTITATSKVSATEIVMDGGTSDPEWGNFVGFGDVYDYAEIVINEAGTYQFTIDTKAGNSKFVVYKLTQKADKTTWTSKTLASVTIKGATDDDGVKLKKAIKIKEADVTSSNIRYFVSMQTTDQKKSPEVYYNVSAWRMDDSPASALTMPEMDSLADSFSMTDSLSLGRYDADVLTGASMADLTDLDNKSAWQNSLLA